MGCHPWGTTPRVASWITHAQKFSHKFLSLSFVHTNVAKALYPPTALPPNNTLAPQLTNHTLSHLQTASGSVDNTFLDKDYAAIEKCWLRCWTVFFLFAMKFPLAGMVGNGMKPFTPDPAEAATYHLPCDPIPGNSPKDELVLTSFPFEGPDKVPELTWGLLVKGLMFWIGWVSAILFDDSHFSDPWWIWAPGSYDQIALTLISILLAE